MHIAIDEELGISDWRLTSYGVFGNFADEHPGSRFA